MPKTATQQVITAKDNFRVRPQDINTRQQFFGAFDDVGTELSANWIVSFLQERGTGWEPFTYEEVDAYYKRSYDYDFRFNRLVEPEMVAPSRTHALAGLIPVGGGWLILKDEKYYVTADFIVRCYKVSPVMGSPEDAELSESEAAERIRKACEHGG